MYVSAGMKRCYSLKDLIRNSFCEPNLMFHPFEFYIVQPVCNQAIHERERPLINRISEYTATANIQMHIQVEAEFGGLGMHHVIYLQWLLTRKGLCTSTDCFAEELLCINNYATLRNLWAE